MFFGSLLPFANQKHRFQQATFNGTTGRLTRTYTSSHGASLNTSSFAFEPGLSAARRTIFSATKSVSEYALIELTAAGKLRIIDYNGSNRINLVTTDNFDEIRWFHLQLRIDTSQAVPADRVTLFIDGAEVTSFSSSTYPAQGASLFFGSDIQHDIGFTQSSPGNYWDGKLTAMAFVTGQALTHTDFGETYGSYWRVLTPDIEDYGTNGFWIDDPTDPTGSGYTVVPDVDPHEDKQELIITGPVVNQYLNTESGSKITTESGDRLILE